MTGISIGTSAVTLIALLNCAFKKPSKFSDIGTLSKGTWLVILAGSIIMSSLGVFGGGALGIFALIGIIAAFVYLLDVRPALNDGHSSW